MLLLIPNYSNDSNTYRVFNPHTDNTFKYLLIKCLPGNLCSDNLIKNTCAGMEVDDVGGFPSQPPTAATAAAAAARTYAEEAARRVSRTQTPPAETPTSSATDAANKKVKLPVNTLFQQCSNAKLADRNVEVHTVSFSTGFTTEKVPVPRIGNMIVEGEIDIANIFHGARIMRGAHSAMM
jgi:hypothetical protein